MSDKFHFVLLIKDIIIVRISGEVKRLCEERGGILLF